MNISVEIKAPELAQAILALATSLGGKLPEQAVQESSAPVQQQAQHQIPTQQPQYSQQPAQQQTPAGVPTAPTTQYQQPTQQQQPVQQQTPQGVPTSAPTYTMDQLAVAATSLMDAGKQNQLLELLASFGAQTMMQLPQEQYGAFATKLRELGAQI